MLGRVLQAIFEAEISSDPEDVKSFREAFDRVKPMINPKTGRLLNMTALALNLAPLTSKFKLLTSMSPQERRLWLEGVNPESLTKDLTVMLEFVALAVYAGFSGKFQARIEYDRPGRVSKVEARGAPKISREGRPLDSYDVIVVGSGAGGAVAAWELARRGFKVVVFEAGPEPPPGEFIGEPPVVRAVKYYWDSGVTFTWGTPTVNIPFGRVLGGTATLNSGTLFRVPGEALSLWGKVSGARVDSGLLEWAYRVVEGRLQAKPVPEHLLGGNAVVMRRGAEALGLKHYPVTRPLGGCLGLGECAFGCPSGGKIDMRLSFLKEAVDVGAHVYVNSIVERVVIEGSKAKSVIVNVGGS
ncbi:MAG: FAD-dependent oxidoreductase, partial [Thermoprotei archaeon]|nr:FAD-dependent oxidoreductase [Thermoprotei archaeon]